jgi:hypothetical protein
VADQTTEILLKATAESDELKKFTKEFSQVKVVAVECTKSIEAMGAQLKSAADLAEIRKLLATISALQVETAKITATEREQAAIRRQSAAESKTQKEQERRISRENEEINRAATKAQRDAAKAAKETADAAKKIKPALDDAKSATEGFSSALSRGLKFIAALTAFQVAKDGVVTFFREGVIEGVRFNAQLETAAISIASVLRQFNPERFNTFNSALERSNKLIEQLKIAALQSPATFDELLTGFQGTAGAMASANIPLEKQVTLMLRMSQALTALGISNQELRQETTALLTGNIDRNARAATSLRITNEQIKQQKELGTLYEFLIAQTAAFGEASDKAQGSVALLQSRLSEAKTLAAADATKELTGTYRELLISLTNLVSSPAFKDMLTGLATGASNALKIARSAIDAITTSANTAPQNAATGKSSALVASGNLNNRLKAIATPQERAALLAEVRKQIEDTQAEINDIYRANLDSNSPLSGADRQRDAYAREILPNLLAAEKFLQSAKSEQVQLANGVVAAQKAEAESTAVAAEAARKAREEARQWLETEGKKIREKANENSRDLLSDKERIKVIDQLVGKAIEAEDIAKDRAKSSEELAKAELQAADIIIPLLKEKEAALKRITADQKEQAAIADRSRVRALQDAAEEAQRQRSGTIAKIEDDRFLTDKQKRARLFGVFQEEAKALPGQIQASDNLASSLPADSATRAAAEAESRRLRDRQRFGNPSDLRQNAPTSTIDDVLAQVTELQNGFMTAGEAVGSTLQGAIDGVASSMQGLLQGTMSWGQALQNIGGSIMNSVIGAISRMFAEWIVGRAAAGVASILWSTKEGAADVAAKTPGALLTSISSFGVAAAIGVAALVAALASFDVGGYTRTGSGGKRIAGVVHENEWVAPDWMTSDPRYGSIIAQLESVRTGSADNIRVSSGMGAVARTGGVYDSGRSSSGPVEGSGAINQAFFNTQQDAEEWLRSQPGRRVMVDFLRKNQYDL